MRVRSVYGGLFQPERFMLSGDVSIIKFPVEVDAGSADDVAAALAKTDLQARFRARIAKRLTAAVGSDYIARGPYLGEGGALTTIVSTGYTEISGPEELLRKIGPAAQSLAGELSDLLKHVLPPQTEYLVRPDWTIAPDILRGSGPGGEAATTEELNERLERFLARRRYQLAIRQRALLAIVIGLMIGVPASIAGVLASPYWFVLAFYPVIFLAVGFIVRLLAGSSIRDVENLIRQVNDEIDLQTIGADPEPRAQKLFQAHSAEIKQYYDQALRQAKNVYFVGVISLAVGVGVIVASFVLVLNASPDHVSEQLIVGGLGAIGAILANFIAVIYLRMFSDTVTALTGFHGRLVATHHLHFGNFVAAQIDDRTRRDETLATMAAEVAATPLDGTTPTARSDAGDTDKSAAKA